MNIEILDERIPTGGYGFIVWDQGGVIESVQVKPFHHRIGHVVQRYSKGGSHVEALSEMKVLTE